MKRSRRTRPSVFVHLAAAALLGALLGTACDDGIGLLTMDERQSLYRAEASGKGSALPVSAANPGAVLDPSGGIRIAFETLRGSEEPAELTVTLRSGAGDLATAVRYRAGTTAATSESEVPELRVPSLASFSATLEVPSEFPDGYYLLVLDARSSRSESLSYSEIGLFLARKPLPSPSILAYPANPSPGSRVLLVANLAGYEGMDPYLRWTVDGTVRSEGLASEGRDKLLWPAPKAGSAAPIGLALYPAAPPPGVVYSFPPPRSASAGLLVAPGTPEAQDEFSRAERFRALFRMEDTPDYAGRPGGGGSFLGSPRMDVHPGGFGLILGGESGAGIRADALLLPVRDGKLLPFTILARLVPAKGPGGLVFRSEAGSSGPSLEISLVEGRPIAVLRSADRSGELRANSLLAPGRPGLLGVTVRPEGSALRVSFQVDAEPAGEGVFGFGSAGWGEAGSTTLAGPGGCPGLYDEVGVWAYDDLGQSAVYPAFRYASRKALGAELRLAEGFEGAYDGVPVLEGGASIDPAEGLLLPAGGIVRFDPGLEGSFEIEAAVSSGAAPFLVLTGSEGSFKVPWNPAAFRTDPVSGRQRFQARIQPAAEGGGLLVFAGGDPVRLPGAGPWKLGLAGPTAGSSRVRSVRISRMEGIEG